MGGGGHRRPPSHDHSLRKMLDALIPTTSSQNVGDIGLGVGYGREQVLPRTQGCLCGSPSGMEVQVSVGRPGCVFLT